MSEFPPHQPNYYLDGIFETYEEARYIPPYLCSYLLLYVYIYVSFVPSVILIITIHTITPVGKQRKRFIIRMHDHACIQTCINNDYLI